MRIRLAGMLRWLARRLNPADELATEYHFHVTPAPSSAWGSEQMLLASMCDRIGRFR